MKLLTQGCVFILRLLLLIAFFQLAACSSEITYAPVTEISTIEPIPATGTHRVITGETLYSIAWRYGKDYRSLAAENHIEAPYHVYLGQIIHLRQTARPKASKVEKPVLPSKQFKDTPAPPKEPAFTVSRWQWPSKGRIVRGFSSSNKGIDIAGHKGQPVYAAAPGKVVYSGDGLRSYGNLIILKHNGLYLSAYAYNHAIIVKEGEWVKQGQKIAEMGIKRKGQAVLHFEIRRAGKPLNPLKLLAK